MSDSSSSLSVRRSLRWVRWRRLGFGVAALVTVFGLVGGYFTAEKRVTAVCAAIKPGMPLPALVRLAKDKGVGLVSPAEGRNLLAEKKTMGRHGCDVWVEGGVVRSSAYFFAD
ncbi:MAG: hypothetical protein EOO25_01740 [Comamonadaceae bacterium]|nr:MAG: hypothetical protein EOO25_01740 [Comamonadaceae bacterium]